ncbi:MAG: aldo/keto reductase [Clostridiales bacterium]|nr:aldo/keto reductase [Clostridiales bacterium]
MVASEFFTLENGVKIPKLGLGTWRISNSSAAQAVRDAVKIGYRHIDTAQGYGNESGVGEGVRTCGVAREEIFVTSKLEAGIKSYDKAVQAIDGSLKDAGLDYLDLMLIHSPKPWPEFLNEDRYFSGNLEAWRAFENAFKAGKLRAIGVSNFEREDLDNILENCSVKPTVNQFLAHISNTPFELVDYCQGKGVLVEAYSPIAHGEMLDNPVIADVAKKYGASVPQLCIRYCLQLGMIPLPKTANPEHMRTNIEIDFSISDEDMAFLKTVPRIVYGEASKFPNYRNV